MLQATIVNTDQLMNAITAIDWMTPSWDVFIIIFFIMASLVYGISLGRDRIFVTLVSLYMGLAVVKYVPYITEFNASITIEDGLAMNVSVFLGIFIILFFLLSQSALVKTLGSGLNQGKMLTVLLFSFLQTGLLISVTLSFFPQDLSQWISPLTQTLFLSDPAKAFWIITPIVAMMIIGGVDKNDRYR